jgi:CHAT domain-containing protein
VADSRKSYYARLEELSQRYPAFAKLDIQPINFAKVQRSIPEDTLVVQLFPTDQELFLMEASRESLKIRRVAMSRAQLDQAVRDVRRQILEARAIDWNAPEAGPLRALLGKLEQALVAPLEPDLTGKKVLAYIPYGSLSYLPVQALCNEQSGKFLVERFQVVTLTKSSDLEQIFGPPSERSGGLVALGNPDGTLPGAADEVERLGQLFPGALVLVGRKAVASELDRVRGPEVAYLHLATHGVLNPGDPRQSYLVMADGQRLSVADIAGYRLDSPQGDVNLVTLSACQTALAGSTVPDGSDLRSLADAFSFAGCRSMLASLWKVDDESTRDLMVMFYQRLKAGDSKGQALQKAQLELMKRRPHPFYWAPFVLIGDWR